MYFSKQTNKAFRETYDNFPLYVMSESRWRQLLLSCPSEIPIPLLETSAPTFWEQRGANAANDLKRRKEPRSLREGSADEEAARLLPYLLFVFPKAGIRECLPIPREWPNELSQLPNINKPIQLSTGPRIGSCPRRYLAPSKDRIYPVMYQRQVGIPSCDEYGTMGAVLGLP